MQRDNFATLGAPCLSAIFNISVWRRRRRPWQPRPRRRPARRGRSGSASGTRLRFYPARAECAGDLRSLVRAHLSALTCRRSLGRGWHRRRVVVDDFPVVAVLHIGEAVAGRNRFGFTVLGIGESVIATVHCVIPVDADQLVPELDRRLRQRLEGADEVGFEGSWVRPYRR